MFHLKKAAAGDCAARDWPWNLGYSFCRNLGPRPGEAGARIAPSDFPPGYTAPPPLKEMVDFLVHSGCCEFFGL